MDLPTPGSPASSTTAPGTIPPPSTRSSSPTPVGRARALSALTSPMNLVVRLMAEAGYKVTVFLFNVSGKLSDDCAKNSTR